MNVIVPPFAVSIPKCNPGLGSMPLEDAGYMLQQLALSCQANPAKVIWQGEMPCPMNFSGRVESVGFFDRLPDTGDGDLLAVMALPLAYQSSWGCFGGLPGQYLYSSGQSDLPAVAMGYVERCLQSYEYAKRHVHLGMDESGECYLSLPRHLVAGQGQPGDPQLALHSIAGDDGRGGLVQVFASGPFIAYRLSRILRGFLEGRGWRFRPGLSSAIGKDLRHLPLSFCPPAAGEEASPYAAILDPLLTEILASDTPRLAATCYLLDYNFRRLAEVVEGAAKRGRKVVGVAGLLLDMHGYQRRGERLFVPWRAFVPERDDVGRVRTACLHQGALFRHLAELSPAMA